MHCVLHAILEVGVIVYVDNVLRNDWFVISQQFPNDNNTVIK